MENFNTQYHVISLLQATLVYSNESLDYIYILYIFVYSKQEWFSFLDVNYLRKLFERKSEAIDEEIIRKFRKLQFK